MGLVNKHNERDQLLPKYRDELIYRIEHDLVNDENVLAIFYGGSIGSGKTDFYSDIDLRIVVKEEVFKDYIKNNQERAKNWGEVLYFEALPGTTYFTAHYSNFVKVDTFFYKMTHIQPSVWLQDIKVVYDETGFMEDVLKKSKELSYKPTAEEVEVWRTKFFAYFHEAYRRVKRNEIYYALKCLDNLRMSMSTAWYMEKGIQPNTLGDWAKYEGHRSSLDDRQLTLLADWYSGRDEEEILLTMVKLVPEFKRVHKSLCEKVKINEDPEWVEEILNLVL